MRLLKWLGVQLWKRPLVSGIFVLAAASLAPSLAAHALPPRRAKAIEQVGEMVFMGLLGLVILLLIIKAARRESSEETNTATVVVAVVAWIVYSGCFQTWPRPWQVLAIWLAFFPGSKVGPLEA